MTFQKQCSAVSKQAKILIVDDSNALRYAIKDIIRSSNIGETLEAKDGFEAIKKYKIYKPDLVLLDINMPKVNGIAALKAIMKINPNAKIIMLTGIEDKLIVQDAIKTGARDYIPKPFNQVDVSIRISKVLCQK